MDRILIKPDAKEIVLRGKIEDGHVDAFSYNYENGGGNGLGSLFIVGHVQPATEDTSYMVNLVASLAKREYYSKPEESPKESFSKTLRKINEVLQDFFRNKENKVDIGIFAVAGESIFISRLGKFKILLSRENDLIDILNNVTLFSKEHVQEKEFSNVISGNVMPKDKIFAFYPARSISAREKNIKTFLTKMGAGEFTEKLNSIKKENENFLCSGIHITINKYTEPEVHIPPQPKELAEPKTILAKAPRTTKAAKVVSAAPVEDTPSVRPQEDSKTAVPSQPIQTNPTPTPPLATPPAQPEAPANNQDKSNVYYPGSNVRPVESSPLIRPTEFSSAKKDNLLSTILKKYKPAGIHIIGQDRLISKKKLILTSSLIVVIGLAAVIGKLTIFPSLPVPGIQSETDKAAKAFLEELKTQLETAQAYKEQNNIFEARKSLFQSLSSIAQSNIQDEDIKKAKQEITALLDEIDKASDTSPSLLFQVSQDIGKSSILASAKDKLLVFVPDPNKPNSGSLLKTSESGIETTTKISDFNPLYIIGGDKLIVMMSNLMDKIGSMAVGGGELKTSSLSISSQALSAYPYQGNIYILASDGIYKITDVGQGKSTATRWLEKDVNLSPQSALIAVDGDIFVMTQSGSLATYYKGKKKSEVSTSIPVGPGSSLLTTQDGPSLYLVDKNFGRIYVIDKTSGSIIKTIKVSSEEPLVSASISETGTIYILTSDNNIWKVNP